MKKSHYILVADSGAAKLYRAEGALKDIELVHERSNPAGRKMRSELDSDRPGQQRNDGGGMHGLGGDSDTPRHESEAFARELCRLLEREREAMKFSDLMIAAPPRFLGELRQHLSEGCLKVLGQTIHKDLVRMPADDILSHFS